MTAPPAVKLTRPPLLVGSPHRVSPNPRLRSLPTPKSRSPHALSPCHHSSISSLSALSSLSAFHSPSSLDPPRSDVLSRSGQPSRARCLRASSRTSIRAAWGSDRRADGSAGSASSSSSASSRHRRPGTVSANGEAATNFAETSATVTGVVPARRVFRGEADRESAQRLREEQLRERALRINGFLERDAEALVVREARPEEYWEAADVHCAAFFPHAPFPLNYILRMDRVSAILANLSMPRGTYKKCLVAFDSPAFVQSLSSSFALTTASPPSSSASASPSPSSSASASPSTTTATIAPVTKTRAPPPEHAASAAIKDFDGERDLIGGPMFRPVLATMLLGPPVLSWTFSGLNVGPRGLVGSVTVDTAGEFLPRRKPHNRRRSVGDGWRARKGGRERRGDGHSIHKQHGRPAAAAQEIGVEGDGESRIREVVIEREEDEEEQSTSEEEEEEEEEYVEAPRPASNGVRLTEGTNGRARGGSRSDESEDEEEGDDEEEDAVPGKAERRGGRSRGGGGAAEGASASGMAGEEAEAAEGGVRKGKSSRIKLNLKSKASGVCRVRGGCVESAWRVRGDCVERHTTATCPHRVGADGGSVAVQGGRTHEGVLHTVQQRQITGMLPRAARHRRVLPSVVEAAVIALHMRRITVLEFHAVRDDVLLSGDKRGHIGLWNYERERDTTVHQSVHQYQISALRHRPTCDEVVLSSSLDGKVCRVDIETGQATVLANLNPLGWQGDERTWGSFYAMDAPARDGGAVVVAGDNFGCIHVLDERVEERVAAGVAGCHAARTKVVSLHLNPADPHLLLSAGSDHWMHLWDVRQLSPQHRIASMQHPRVVNSAYFSPITGTRILSTCQDNRLRVWDSVFCDLQHPSSTIVHSHDFNRYLSPFKAHWDPKDDAERVVVCGRYISDDYNGVALHPIDFLDASSGALLGSAVDPHLTTISPVNLPHPRCDLLATGSSRSIYLWTVPEDAEEGEGEEIREASQQGYESTGRAGQQQAVSASFGNRGTIRMFNADIWGKGRGKGHALGNEKTQGNAKVSGKGKGRGKGKGKAGEEEEDEALMTALVESAALAVAARVGKSAGGKGGRGRGKGVVIRAQEADVGTVKGRRMQSGQPLLAACTTVDRGERELELQAEGGGPQEEKGGGVTKGVG
ncbi:unnamed protein product [Closterium sp. Naga37s-1]|nr:unnamed protein product [Closterium sp. Naga37s-1]